MTEVATIGLDIAKSVFQVHGVDQAGVVVVRRQLKRGQLLKFFGGLEPALVGIEACGSAHFWARELVKFGHTVQLIPPAYVKPYVKRQKNDAADAEAICEAVGRPNMRFVPVKSEAQQGACMLHRTRALLVKQRTMLLNAVRAHLGELGLSAGAGVAQSLRLVHSVLHADHLQIEPAARAALEPLARLVVELEERILDLEKEIGRWHQASGVSRLRTGVQRDPRSGVIGVEEGL